MKRSKNGNGREILFYSCEIVVTGSEFVSHLADWLYGNDEKIDGMTKTKAKGILKIGIRNFGRNSEYNDENLGSDTIDHYDICYVAAENWVKKNYPFLFESN